MRALERIESPELDACVRQVGPVCDRFTWAWAEGAGINPPGPVGDVDLLPTRRTDRGGGGS